MLSHHRLLIINNARLPVLATRGPLPSRRPPAPDAREKVSKGVMGGRPAARDGWVDATAMAPLPRQLHRRRCSHVPNLTGGPLPRLLPRRAAMTLLPNQGMCSVCNVVWIVGMPRGTPPSPPQAGSGAGRQLPPPGPSPANGATIKPSPSDCRRPSANQTVRPPTAASRGEQGGDLFVGLAVSDACQYLRIAYLPWSAWNPSGEQPPLFSPSPLPVDLAPGGWGSGRLDKPFWVRTSR